MHMYTLVHADDGDDGGDDDGGDDDGDGEGDDDGDVDDDDDDDANGDDGVAGDDGDGDEGDDGDDGDAIVQILHQEAKHEFSVGDLRGSITTTNGIKQGCDIAPCLWAFFSVSVMLRLAEARDMQWLQSLVTIFCRRPLAKLDNQITC